MAGLKKKTKKKRKKGWGGGGGGSFSLSKDKAVLLNVGHGRLKKEKRRKKSFIEARTRQAKKGVSFRDKNVAGFYVYESYNIGAYMNLRFICQTPWTLKCLNRPQERHSSSMQMRSQSTYIKNRYQTERKRPLAFRLASASNNCFFFFFHQTQGNFCAWLVSLADDILILLAEAIQALAPKLSQRNRKR